MGQFNSEPEKNEEPPLDFNEVTIKEGHIIFGQYMKILSHIQDEARIGVDLYKDERRKALDRKDDEKFNYLVLKQLEDEMDQQNEVVENLIKNVKGFTVEQFEEDGDYYMGVSFLKDEILRCASDRK